VSRYVVVVTGLGMPETRHTCYRPEAAEDLAAVYRAQGFTVNIAIE